jgi:hypothetical protein
LNLIGEGLSIRGRYRNSRKEWDILSAGVVGMVDADGPL